MGESPVIVECRVTGKFSSISNSNFIKFTHVVYATLPQPLSLHINIAIFLWQKIVHNCWVFLSFVIKPVILKHKHSLVLLIRYFPPERSVTELVTSTSEKNSFTCQFFPLIRDIKRKPILCKLDQIRNACRQRGALNLSFRSLIETSYFNNRKHILKANAKGRRFFKSYFRSHVILGENIFHLHS